MILLGIGLPIFIPVLWIMLALTAMTWVAGRFWRIWQIAASADPPRTQAGQIHHHSTRIRRGLSRSRR